MPCALIFEMVSLGGTRTCVQQESGHYLNTLELT